LRIVAIADTHISDRSGKLPEKLLAEIKRADALIHAGDFVDLKLLNELKSICSNLWAVRGNMDSAEIASKLPEKEIIKVGKFKVGIMHGFGAPDKIVDALLKTFEKDKPDLIVFGHSHKALNEKNGGIIMFNPGSPTDTFFAPYNSYGIIEINDTIKTEIVKL